MTSKEWEEINKIIKEEVKQGKKTVVRKMIDKTMTFNDCLTVLKAFSGHNPINTPATVETIENKPINGSEMDSISDNPQNQLERVNGDIVNGDFNINEIKDNVLHLITVFCDTYDIQDLTKAPQRQFTALSTFIGDNLFKGNRILWDKTPVDNGSAMTVYNYMYDWDIVACMVSFYITICNLYNKAFLFDGVAGFLHMSENTLKDNNDKLTARGIDIYKKHEDMLSAGIIDGKQSPVGILAHLNHYHGWTTGQTHTEKKETIVIYPSLSSNQAQSTPQINTTETKQVL